MRGLLNYRLMGILNLRNNLRLGVLLSNYLLLRLSNHLLILKVCSLIIILNPSVVPLLRVIILRTFLRNNILVVHFLTSLLKRVWLHNLLLISLVLNRLVALRIVLIIIKVLVYCLSWLACVVLCIVTIKQN